MPSSLRMGSCPIEIDRHVPTITWAWRGASLRRMMDAQRLRITFSLRYPQTSTSTIRCLLTCPCVLSVALESATRSGT
ncbi:hypothetical protein RSAG8_08008, partial [Rhizoctonia solani AG-8 WAC10335]